MLFMVAFSVSVLAALGTERLLLRRISVSHTMWWLAGAGALALLATFGGLTNLAKVIASSWAGDQLDDVIASNNGAVVLGAWRALLVVGLVTLFAWLLAKERVERRAIGLALIALIALDFFSVEKQYWLFSARASKLYASDPALDYVHSQREPARVINEPLGRANVPDPMLHFDGPMVRGIRLATGYHGNEIGRFQRLCGATPDTRCLPQILFSPTFWRHENIQYLYTNVDSAAVHQFFVPTLGVPEPKKVLGPVSDAAGSQVYLYRLAGENPAAWLATAFVKAPEDQALQAVLDPKFDPTRIAILDTNSSIAGQQITVPPPPTSTPVHVTSYAPGEIRLRIDSSPPAGTALVVSENFFSGWSALVDGRPAPVDRVEYNLIGVQLPANSKAVELHFDDPAYERGKAITLVALLVAIVLVVVGAVRQRGSEDRLPLAV
jgi:hypothetical protein